MSSSGLARKGWVVALAGLGINLALGVLYSWSVVAKTLTKDWGWSAGKASVPYAVAVGVFALTMVFAGRAQDRFGPRLVATLGGLLCGLGLVVAAFTSRTRPDLMVLGFGVMSGAGIGLGYAAATPAAVKWFPAAKKGAITGLVVSGFGLASVYIAPLTTWLLGTLGVKSTFLVLGASFAVVTAILAQFLTDPPAGYRPLSAVPAGVAPDRDYDWDEMVVTPQFKLLWFMYAFSAFAGLMIIGHMAKIAALQMSGADLGFLLVAVLAVGNAGGRLAAGIVADKLGGTRTMLLVFLTQAVLMGALWMARSPLALVPVAAMVGSCYGANLALFPSTTAGFFGTKHLGVNYGLVFTAWGVGGVFGSMVAGSIVDSTGTYALAYASASGLCVLAAAMTFATKAPDPDRMVVGLRKRLHKAA